MFPHVMQPLHIFEPRYRALLADALAGDRMIAMMLPAPAGKSTTKPAAAAADGCLTRVAMHQKQADDRSNVLLLGLRRLRLLRELPLPTVSRGGGRNHRRPVCARRCRQPVALQHALVQAFRKVLPQLGVATSWSNSWETISPWALDRRGRLRDRLGDRGERIAAGRARRRLPGQDTAGPSRSGRPRRAQRRPDGLPAQFSLN